MSRKSIKAVSRTLVAEGEREYGPEEFRRRCSRIGSAFPDVETRNAFSDEVIKTGNGSKILFHIEEAVHIFVYIGSQRDWLRAMLGAEIEAERRVGSYCPLLDEFMTRVSPSRNA